MQLHVDDLQRRHDPGKDLIRMHTPGFTELIAAVPGNHAFGQGIGMPALRYPDFVIGKGWQNIVMEFQNFLYRVDKRIEASIAETGSQMLVTVDFDSDARGRLQVQTAGDRTVQ